MQEPDPQKNSDMQNLYQPLLGQSLSSLFLGNILNSLTREGLYYHRKTIELDGLTFNECSFDNCQFITRTGDFKLKNCRIQGSETTFQYQGAAFNIVRLHEFMNAAVVGKIVFPNIFPQVDNDGRVTIG